MTKNFEKDFLKSLKLKISSEEFRNHSNCATSGFRVIKNEKGHI